MKSKISNVTQDYGVYSRLRWDDLRAPATSINPQGAPSPASYNDTEIGFDFSATADNNLASNFQMSHQYAEGTDIDVHIHWEQVTTNVGKVSWQLSYRWYNVNEAIPAFTVLNPVVHTTDGVANKHVLTELAKISKTNAQVSSMLDIKIARLGDTGGANDTYTGIARLKEIDIHYQKDAAGSIPEYSK